MRTVRTHRPDPRHEHRALCGLTNVALSDQPDEHDCQACAATAARREDVQRLDWQRARKIARQRAIRALIRQHPHDYDHHFQQALHDLTT